MDSLSHNAKQRIKASLEICFLCFFYLCIYQRSFLESIFFSLHFVTLNNILKRVKIFSSWLPLRIQVQLSIYVHFHLILGHWPND